MDGILLLSLGYITLTFIVRTLLIFTGGMDPCPAMAVQQCPSVMIKID